MRYPRGSLWWRWDLHVHSPASLVQHYGGNTDKVWERFLGDLENLPKEFKVIGINDYIFLEGYERVLAERKNGRLKNIDLVLPVIELRLDKFGGSTHHLRRVNFHVIFSDKLSVDTIQHQFINALRVESRLNAGDSEPAWSGILTKESIEHFGQAIIESVPEAERIYYADPLLEGFNNINFSLDAIREVLKSSYFKNKVVTAVGKTEWADIRWQDGSIADKKDIINGADLVFMAAENPGNCIAARESLKGAEVNSRLLDCSDAHDFQNSAQKDRIGNCFTWINADTEFEGLLQTIKEPEGRIYLGREPDQHQRLKVNRTKYIKSIAIKKVANSTLAEPWFDGTNIELNPGLVAVIGNKGSGKSAFVDIVGLLGDTARYEEASFLNAERFCNPAGNKASHFTAELSWEDGRKVTRRLDKGVPPDTVEAVTYIPQKLFDEICNELVGTEPGRFDKELQQVIFSHVGEADRLGLATLDQLIDYRTDELNNAINQYRNDLSQLNREIIELERQATPEYRRQLENYLARAKAELVAHDAIKPDEVSAPPDEPDAAMQETLAELGRWKNEYQRTLDQIEAAKDQQRKLAQEVGILDRIEQRLTNFQRTYDSFVSETLPELQKLDLQLGYVLSVSINRGPLETARNLRQDRQQRLSSSLDEENLESLVSLSKRLSRQVENSQQKLDEPNRRYQRYQAVLKQWTERQASIIGSGNNVETLEYYKAKLAELDNIPNLLEERRKGRREVAQKIHSLISERAGLYRQLYEPVQQFISEHVIARHRLKLEFDVSVVDAGFEAFFLDWIHKARKGSFSGVDESASRVSDIINRHDFNSSDKSIDFTEEILKNLQYDYRTSDHQPVKITDQLRAGKTEQSLLDFLFGFQYLRPRYLLKMGDRELHQLSPGEKGALLVVFYLLVDRNDHPLLIDQPEENLDNETIVDLLVPSIREAKHKRQIVIVTHNPNLAVVCDADQVIYAKKSMQGMPRIEYKSGAFENPLIQSKTIDVLEGKPPAFKNRSSKYQLS